MTVRGPANDFDRNKFNPAARVQKGEQHLRFNFKVTGAAGQRRPDFQIHQTEAALGVGQIFPNPARNLPTHPAVDLPPQPGNGQRHRACGCRSPTQPRSASAFWTNAGISPGRCCPSPSMSKARSNPFRIAVVKPVFTAAPFPRFWRMRNDRRAGLRRHFGRVVPRIRRPPPRPRGCGGEPSEPAKRWFAPRSNKESTATCFSSRSTTPAYWTAGENPRQMRGTWRCARRWISRCVSLLGGFLAANRQNGRPTSNASVLVGRARTPCAPWRAAECPPYLRSAPSLTHYAGMNIILDNWPVPSIKWGHCGFQCPHLLFFISRAFPKRFRVCPPGQSRAPLLDESACPFDHRRQWRPGPGHCEVVPPGIPG